MIIPVNQASPYFGDQYPRPVIHCTGTGFPVTDNPRSFTLSVTIYTSLRGPDITSKLALSFPENNPRWNKTTPPPVGGAPTGVIACPFDTSDENDVIFQCELLDYMNSTRGASTKNESISAPSTPQRYDWKNKKAFLRT